MSEAKHTPGPWRIETVDTSVGICHKIGPFPAEYAIRPNTWACVYVDGMPRGHGALAETLLANARLIAASPHLLGVAKAALAFLQLGYTVGLGNVNDDVVDQLEERLKAAIAASNSSS